MRLNKKGFAFSTMLYGTVALIAAVLYIILNISKTSKDTTYYYGEVLLKDLNSCVTEEIQLENCYSSSSDINNCNPRAYRACLGVSDIDIAEKGVIISEKIKGISGSGLIEDVYESKPERKRYIYTGTTANNYIEFSGKVWRIVSIESDGSLALIDTAKYGTLAWDSSFGREWLNSTLFQQLNNGYLTTISDSTKLASGKWRMPFVEPNIVGEGSERHYVLSLDNLIIQEQIEDVGYVSYNKVGILSLSDYIKITDNQNCKDDMLSSTSTSCNSWLTEYKGWVIDINSIEGNDSNGKAFYFATGNKVEYDDTTSEHDVYPVIYLDRNSIYVSGTGTLSDPFVVK